MYSFTHVFKTIIKLKCMQSEIKEPVVCAFANQKGGVGKTTLTHLIAKTITDPAIGKKCLVIEVDKQKSLSDLKNTIQENMGDKFVMPYDLRLLNDLEDVKELVEKEAEKYDIIILDTPGTLDKRGLVATLSIADIVLIPLNSSILEVNSSVDFIQTMYKVKEYRATLDLPFDYYTVLNRVDNKTRFYKSLVEELGENKINRFTATIKDLEAYRNFHMENYNPVYSYAPRGKKDAGFEAFVEEFLNVVQNMREKIKLTVNN